MSLKFSSQRIRWVTQFFFRTVSLNRPELMVKKLRYYARFIVVCLLLKKMKLVRDLVRELAKHIDEYTATYEPDDQVRFLNRRRIKNQR